jgi:hypothetical protein
VPLHKARSVEYASVPVDHPRVDHDIYLIEDDFGQKGRCWRETDGEETVIGGMLDGHFRNPIRVISFNTAEGWSLAMSEDVALECASDARSQPIPRAHSSSDTN